MVFPATHQFLRTGGIVRDAHAAADSPRGSIDLSNMGSGRLPLGPPC
jgi:hypothetical protein